MSRSVDLSRLRSEGYDIDVIDPPHLVMRHVPYLNSRKEVAYGTLVTVLDIGGEETVKPSTHVLYFLGDPPCDQEGSILPGVSANVNHSISKDITAPVSISRRPRTHDYADYHEKMTTYVDILGSPVATIDPKATALTFPVVVPREGESVFKYLDTGSTKAGIYAANRKLEGHKLAIVGGGGTAAYVLDFVAKTPVAEVHVFDRDIFLNHNAFRCPGAASLADLEKKPLKVDYLAGVYSNMRTGIIPHPCFVDGTTVDQLRGMDFVFLCIDKSAVKQIIVERLEEWGISFIDVGMGVYLVDDALCGTLAITTSTPNKRDHLRNRVSFTDGNKNNDYSMNVQIAELNAMNAALAVIKWKKLCGYFHDDIHEHYSAFSINDNSLINEDRE